MAAPFPLLTRRHACTLAALSDWLRALGGSRRRRVDRGGGRQAASSAGAQAAAPVAPSAIGGGGQVPIGADRLADTRKDLRRLLDRHAATRTVWPSLALIERAMGKHGWAGVDRMSPQVLHDAAMVLDELTDERCDPGVIVLRERMAALLDSIEGSPLVPSPRCKAQRGGPTQVREGSFTEFMEIDREWEQQVRAAMPIAASSR
jgi:hypothetical protein